MFRNSSQTAEVDIHAPRTGEWIHLAVESSAGEKYLIAFLDSERNGACEPCELSPTEARELARTLSKLLQADSGSATFEASRTGQQLNLAVETEGTERYLITWLGRTTADGGYEPSELRPKEVYQLISGLRLLADVAEHPAKTIASH